MQDRYMILLQVQVGYMSLLSNWKGGLSASWRIPTLHYY